MGVSAYFKVERHFFKREVGALCVSLRGGLKLLQGMMLSPENPSNKKMDTSIREFVSSFKKHTHPDASPTFPQPERMCSCLR